MLVTVISGVIVAATAVMGASATFILALVVWDEHKENKCPCELDRNKVRHNG